MDDKEISFTIERRFGALGEPGRSGWTKELNFVSWNDREAKLDIREWAPDHGKMGRGITLTREEALSLAKLLSAALR